MPLDPPPKYRNPARDRAFELQTNCDFSETAIMQSAIQLGGVELHDLTVFVALEDRSTARKLQALHGFELHLVPAALFRTPYAWAVWYQGRCVYSDGCY